MKSTTITSISTSLLLVFKQSLRVWGYGRLNEETGLARDRLNRSELVERAIRGVAGRRGTALAAPTPEKRRFICKSLVFVSSLLFLLMCASPYMVWGLKPQHYNTVGFRFALPNLRDY